MRGGALDACVGAQTGRGGPASHADNVQKEFHDLVGGDEPMGWDTQLPDEPVINVGYTVAHLLARGQYGRIGRVATRPRRHVGLARISPASASVCMARSAGIWWTLGGTALREGFNAASTVGVGPVEGWSVSFFAGFGGYGIGTICRSTAPSSRTADPSTRSPSSAWARSASRCDMGVSCSASRSLLHRAFETQQKAAEFGTLSVSWYF